MDEQMTFTDIEYAGCRQITRRGKFLAAMDELIPWKDWVGLISPHYFKGKRGRPPCGVETMLRMYLLQTWYSLSDQGVEEAICESYSMRKFMGINFFQNQVPDATTLLKFRHLLDQFQLAEALFKDVALRLEKTGLIMQGGSIVDATIIQAPSSTKNKSGERDPEMDSTQKGKQWYFGGKGHVGVDAGTGYVHSLSVTAANVHDITQAAVLIRKGDKVLYGDSGYVGLGERPEMGVDPAQSPITLRINARRGTFRKQPEGVGKKWNLHIEQRKSSVRSKVEHCFHVVKNLFRFRKFCYRGLAKNTQRLFVLMASVNLYYVWKSGRQAEFRLA